MVKNPNAQKINNHQPLSDLWGLVAVTNAEKVILDKWDKEKGSDRNLYTAEEWEEVKLSNELREIIKRIPSLSIYIDEVHHASDSDIKLRQVVNQWTESQHFNSVLGFSGTPYLKTAENVTLGGNFAIRNTDLSNVVYKAKNWSFYEGRFVPKKRTAVDGKVWWCAFDTVDGCYSKSPYHGKYKTKRSCEIRISWSIKEYNHLIIR